MEKAVVVFSGGVDSVCSCAILDTRYEMYGLSFAYGQRASREIGAARELAERVGLREHTVIDIGFMREIYGGTNVLTDQSKSIPGRFEYCIVAPIRNAVFLTIAAARAYSIGASLVAYGAHSGDSNYPDCRPRFVESLHDAIREGEIDGIMAGLRRELAIWSPFMDGLTKEDLLRRGYERYGDLVFETWSCYMDGRMHCGECESCRNRRAAFEGAGIRDMTPYACH